MAQPVQRFLALDDDERERFRHDLDAYVRAYGFLAQIVIWTDGELEKLYVFARSRPNGSRPSSTGSTSATA